MSVAYFVRQIEDHEKIKKIIYRSVWMYIPALLVATFFIWSALFGYFWLEARIGQLSHVLVWGIIFLGVFILARTFMKLKYTAWVVTNKRLLDFDQQSFWKIEMSGAALSDLHSPELMTTGFWEAIGACSTLRLIQESEQAVLEISGVRRGKKVLEWVEKQLSDMNVHEVKEGKKKSAVKRLRRQLGKEQFAKIVDELQGSDD